MTFSLPVEKLDEFFADVAGRESLFIPVDDGAGKTNFCAWTSGAKFSQNKTSRSAKEFFFPKTERLVNLKMQGQKITVDDPRKEMEDFVLFGVKACDAAGLERIDAVYLNMTPCDTYYKNRREHGVVVTLACAEPKDTCFCCAMGIDALEPGGDVSAWRDGENFYFKANTGKGEKFLKGEKSFLCECDEKPIEKIEEAARPKFWNLPFARLDLEKWNGKDMLKIFNSKIWDGLSQSCLGCGTCTYVCSTCMCFDVRDFDTGDGIQQSRCWDSCMFSDFTQMAAANPRLTQKERFRQRFMHKLVYYPMAHDGKFQCVGCGRCLESCPINMNIVKVIKALNESVEE